MGNVAQYRANVHRNMIPYTRNKTQILCINYY